MEIKDNKKFSVVLFLQVLLLVVLPLVPCFNDLGKLPIRIWDEARQAHNAYEMYYSHHYWVPTFDGIPDTFGTKPAILIWMQVWSMKIFGINEFAVRFPSALSAYMLSIAVMLFVWYYFKSYSTALIAGIFLLSSEALVRTHVARTGDFDAPLAFFSGVACMSFFIFLDKGRIVFWYLTCLFFALAVLMKGTAGLLFMPSLFIFTLIRHKFNILFKSIHTYVGIVLFLILGAGYYLIRDAHQPGYIQLVLDSEWKSMYLKPTQGHVGNPWFYVVNFYSKWFHYYWYFLPLGMASIFFIKNPLVKSIGSFCICCIVGFTLIISLSATKLFWYDAPLYSFIVILCACFFYLIEEKLRAWKIIYSRRMTLQALMVIVFGVFGFFAIKPKIINTQEEYKEKYYYAMATYLQQANKNNWDLSGYKILSGQGYAPHHTFYLKQMEARGQRVSAASFDDLQVNDSVMVLETNMNELVLKKFNTTQLRNENDIFAYRLDSLKNQ
jgi:4-amino-4-deoxy-L-arabinose transferase-like glycosyltransferase